MNILLIVLSLFLSSTIAAQQISWEDWEHESQTDIRLVPEYGGVEKTEEQKKSDNAFVQTVLEQDSTLQKGSAHLVELGFKYLYQDVKTAMYRFNQAYLLDSTNTDIYSGFGAVYMVLGNYEKAKEQYEKGLQKEPNNTHLLTDYGTYLMAQYYAIRPIDEAKASKFLDAAITYMARSYDLDSTDQNTTFKLSTLYFSKNDCANAWKFYDECKRYGGQPITEVYTKALQKNCKRRKK